MARELGMFAKHWEPGRVKTRLAAEIGHAAAAELHRLSLATLLRRFAAVGDARVLAYAPTDARDAFAGLAGDEWRLEPQCEGDLGRRIEAHFASTFSGGAACAVLIGSDSPTLPDSYIEDAFDRLATVDAVAGPCDDGGYYLIGLRQPIGGLFRDIAWSTPQVFTQTLERLCDAGVRYDVLRPWYDVDTQADLLRLRRELAQDQRPEFSELRQLVCHRIGGSRPLR